MTTPQRDVWLQVTASLAAAISLLERGGKRTVASDKMFRQMIRDYKSALEDARAVLAAEEPNANVTVATLRDQFAMAALTGMLAKSDWHPSKVKKEAYAHADAMLTARLPAVRAGGE